MIAYKVTAADGSSYSFALCEYACCNYKVGQYTKPQRGCGPLFAFETEAQARKFLESERLEGVPIHNRAKLWKCRISRSQQTYGWYRKYGVDGECFKWNPIFYSDILGVIFCSAIKLLEEIET